MEEHPKEVDFLKQMSVGCALLVVGVALIGFGMILFIAFLILTGG